MLADYLLYRFNLQYAYALNKWHKELTSTDSAEGACDDQPLLACSTGLTRSASPSTEPVPLYISHLPLPRDEPLGPTNDIVPLLSAVAQRAPGTLSRGGVHDLDGAAEFVLQRWREGRLGHGELDLALWEYVPDRRVNEHGIEESVEARIDRLVRRHFEEVQEAQDGKGFTRSEIMAENKDEHRVRNVLDEAQGGKSDTASASPSASATSINLDGSLAPKQKTSDADAPLPVLLSNHQARKRLRAEANRIRIERLRARGVIPAARSKAAVRGNKRG